MPAARIRLASLWLSQVARVLADCTLRTVLVLRLAESVGWQQATLFSILPFVLLTPLIGAICNALPKRTVLAGSCAYSLVATAALLLLAEGPLAWYVGLALVMIGGAIYSPTRYALLPAGSADTHIPLSRVNGWIDLGGAAAVGGGLLLGANAYKENSVIFGVLLGLNVVALLAATFADFPSDVRRLEPVGPALRGFFGDCGRILRDREAAACLFGMAAFLAIIAGGGFALLERTGALAPETLVTLSWLFAGVAAGAVVAGLQGHPRRVLGLVVPGLVGTVAVLMWAAVSREGAGPGFALGCMAGLVMVSLRATFEAAVSADARGNAMALSGGANYLGAGLAVGLAQTGFLGAEGQLWLLAGLSVIGCLVAGWALLRETFEQFLEIVFWPVYRIYGHGPGLERLPPHGPLLIVTNHAAWFDPMWVAKVIRREIFPMMTSDFYDRPGVHFFFAHVFHAVRVQASAFRREAPELRDAIAVLDRGDCLSIFPEGWLRRSPEPTVRQFGQGVWHILRERPTTTVVVCWIEGGWGTYTSYFKGKPTVNKRPDFWRRIDVAVSEPLVLPEEMLADQRATRIFLMRKCLEARGFLGLEVPSLPEMIEEKEKPAVEE